MSLTTLFTRQLQRLATPSITSAAAPAAVVGTGAVLYNSYATAITTRSFSAAPFRMAEGDTGAPRSGGAAQGDAFTKREQASEDFYVKEQEKRKLEEMKKRVADKEAELAKDRKEIEDMQSKQ